MAFFNEQTLRQTALFQRLLIALVGTLGLTVLAGWAIGSEAMVRILRHSAAMSFNTAFLFVVAAIALWPEWGGRRLPLLPYRICTGLLIVLPVAVLFQYASGINLGIDWSALHALVNDGNPKPGRMALNTCLGMLFIGCALLSFPGAAHNMHLRQLLRVSVYATLVIGVSGLLGYLLDLENLYRIANLNRMSAPTGVGLTALGIVLWVRMRLSHWVEDADSKVDDRLILRSAAVVLTVAVLATGLACFTVLKQGFERSTDAAALRAAINDSRAIGLNLHFRLTLPSNIANYPSLGSLLAALESRQVNRKDIDQLKQLAQSFIPVGVSGMRILAKDGTRLITTGRMMHDEAATSLPVNHAGQYSRLFWKEGYGLWTEIDVVHLGKTVGKIQVEQRLPFLTSIFEEAQRDTSSTDILLCGRDGNDAICFPSRFYPPNQRIPMFKDGKPYLAISRALLNETGTITVKDLRGIPVLAAFAPVDDLGLGFVLKTDTTELYAPIRQRLNLIALLLIALIAGGTMVLRQRVQPLARRVYRNEQRMKTVLDNVGDAFVEIDMEGKVTDWNPAAERIFGWSWHEAIGKPMAELIIPPRMHQAYYASLEGFMKTGRSNMLNRHVELTGKRRDGSEFSLDAALTATESYGTSRIAIFMHDISERKEFDEKLKASETRLRDVTDNLPTLISYFDTEQRFRFANRMYESWLGFKPDDLIGKQLLEKIGEDLYNQRRPWIERALAGESVSFYVESVAMGVRRHLHTSYIPDKAEDGTVRGFYAFSTDMTALKDYEKALERMARFDALTGLANRYQFNERLNEAMARCRRAGRPMALLYLDIDKFKSINDRLGHGGGDAVLKEFAARLKSTVRGTDTVARLAGDEFTIVLEGLRNVDEPPVVARKILEQIGRPFKLANGDEQVGTSIGIAVYTGDAVSSDQLMERADKALYEAKEKGRNCYVLGGG